MSNGINKHKAKVMALAKNFNKENVKASGLETGKDFVFGAIAGGVLGVIIGKPSLLAGIGVTFIGHMMKWPVVSTAGVGMMASGSSQVTQSIVSGVEGVDGFEEAKARMKTFITGLKDRLYLDKIIKPKTETASTTNGLGNVQYFKYPTQNELDMGSLETIERELANSARQYQTQMAGPDEQILGPDDQILGPDDDRLY